MARSISGLRPSILAVLALLTACGRAQETAAPYGLPRIVAGRPSLSAFAFGPMPHDSSTYVSNASASTVEAYPSNNRKNQGPICEVTGLDYPQGITVDGAGTLYVSTGLRRTYGVVTFAPNCGPQGPNFDEYVGLPEDPVVDGTTLYVGTTNDVALPGLVEVYDIHGSSQPIATLSDPTVSEGIGVAVDSHHNLFWSTTNLWSGGGQVIEFRRGKRPGSVLRGTINSDFPGGVLIDKSNDLLVVDQSATAVDIYAPPYTASPKAIIGLKGAAVYCALGAGESKIYCLDYANASVDAYMYPAGTYLFSYNNGIEANNGPIGIAIQRR